MNIPGTDIPLDHDCWQCAGFGDLPNDERTNRNEPRRKVCDVCHGTGRRLTAEGRELADFIERHFGIKRLGG